MSISRSGGLTQAGGLYGHGGLTLAGGLSAIASSSALSRIPEITTIYGGRTATVPQSFFDAMAVEAVDENTHPHMHGWTHVAVQDGNWSDPETWDAGTVPGDDAVVNCGAFDITYDVESDDLVKDIHIGGSGIFRFDASIDTRLYVDTLMCHGTFLMGTAEAPIEESATQGKPRAEIIFHQTEAPGVTTRLGLVTMGPVRIVGAEKSDRLQSSSDILTGATSCTLSGLSSANWRVGDKILFVATEDPGANSATDAQYTGPTQFYGPFEGSSAVRTRGLGYRVSQDEVRTITDISGSTVSWADALEHDHKVYTRPLARGQAVLLKPYVCSLSRSIRLRSDDPSTLQTRAHTMFMHCDDIDVRYMECKDMARTDVDPSLKRPDGVDVRATDGGTIITNEDNVRGRYAIHIHGTGAYFGRQQVIVKGCVCWADQDDLPQPGWAITHHNSRAAIENCVVYNVRGAGIVSENGNEIGQWIDNTVVWCRGDGFSVSWGTRAEQWPNHNGHAGVAYENQARQILQRGNVAASANIGWLYMQQDVDRLKRIPDMYSLRLYDPVTQGAGAISGEFNQDEDTYGIEQAQIPDFDDNICLATRTGFQVAHRQFTDRYDTTPMIARGFHCINARQAFVLTNYSFHYYFYDSVWIGDGSSTAAPLGNVSWTMNFINIYVENFATGFGQAGSGFNYNGWWCDIEFVDVATPFTHFTADWDITAWQAANPTLSFPEDHALYELMGPWTTTGGTPGESWQGILRTWQNLDSEDFPQPYPAAPRGPGAVSPAQAVPYFELDPASDVTLTTAANSISVQGTIVDGMGARFWPDLFSSESFGPSSTSSRQPKTNLYGTGLSLVARNGCFNDSGTWKMRAWFAEVERLSGDYFQFYIDFTLVGFSADFLAANEVNPIKPQLPLHPESIGSTARLYVEDTTTPTITSASSASVTENSTFALVLKANDGHISWSITGGADAAEFEIDSDAGVYTLRWAGDGTKDYELPEDAGANNVYNVTVRATNALGYYSEQSHTITVTDVSDPVTPDLDLNFTTGSLPSGVTFTRTGTAWYFGTDGLLKSAAGNAPRFGTGGPGNTAILGMMMEEARTNLALYSRDLTQTEWAKSNTTAALDQTGIDGGSNTASKITATAANGTVLQTFTGASGRSVFSVFLKRITGTGNVQVTVNGGTTWTTVAVTNDWLRFSAPDATVTNPQFGIRLATSGDAVAVDVAQLERPGGSSTIKATSPIITTSASVTRNAESAVYSNMSWYNQTEGTINAEYHIADNAAVVGSHMVFSVSDNSTSNQFSVGQLDTTAVLFTRISNGGTAANPANTGNGQALGVNKVGLAYKAGSGNTYTVLNGNTAVTSSPAAFPSAATLSDGLRIACNPSGIANRGPLNGHIRRIRCWDFAMTQTDLQALTA